MLLVKRPFQKHIGPHHAATHRIASRNFLVLKANLFHVSRRAHFLRTPHFQIFSISHLEVFRPSRRWLKWHNLRQFIRHHTAPIWKHKRLLQILFYICSVPWDQKADSDVHDWWFPLKHIQYNTNLCFLQKTFSDVAIWIQEICFGGFVL